MPAFHGANLAPDANRDYAIGLARAFGGAILFAVPLLMTMEMWSLGLHLERDRFLLFVVLDLALLAGLSHFTGFEHTEQLRDDILDALTAFGVGAIASTIVLTLFGLLTPGTPPDELLGRITLQA